MKFSSSPFKPIFRQLLIGVGVSLTVVGFGATWVNYRVVSRDLEYQVNKRATAITQSLQLSSEGFIELGYFPMLERVVTNYASLPDVLEVAIVNPQGKTISHSSVVEINRPFGEIHPTLEEFVQQASETGEVQGRSFRLNGQPVFVEVLPFSNFMFGDRSQRGVAIAIIDLEPLRGEAKRSFLINTSIIVCGIIATLIIVNGLIHREVLAPISKLNKAVADTKTSGDFQFQEDRINNEITFLASTFSEVYGQLASYEELQEEVKQRKKVEIALRASEAEERKKSEELEQTIVQLQEAQLQLVQTEKMSSLGQMVAGLAHEINNPVNFISNNLEYANTYLNDLLKLVTLFQKTYPDSPEEIEEFLEDIDFEFIQKDAPNLFKSVSSGSERIRDLVISLRNFSRLDQAEQKDVDIHEGIDSTLVILQNRLERLKTPQLQPIELCREYGDIPLVSCYPSQLNQVFMNLISNAIDALEEVVEGKITIATKSIADNRVQVAIADNGSGVKEEIRDTIFDPFFTTKAIGKGTGLGLSISYKIIVEEHEGSIRCESEEGKGTTFIIEIPYARSTESSK